MASLPLDEDSLSDYVSGVKKIPMLSEDKEFELAMRWKEKKDQKALDEIVAAHLKLVVKIAKGYSGYGLSIMDLIAEGNLGIMHAVQHFDPSVGYRFSTYAAWWIKSKIQEFVYNSWSIVRLSTSKNNRKLFFGLNKIKKMLGITSDTDADMKAIAEKMQVPVEDVKLANTRLTHKDFSSNTPVGDEGDSSWQDFLMDSSQSQRSVIEDRQEYLYRKKILHDALNTLTKREYDIVRMYRLQNPTKSLREIADIMNLSAERVRQIEKTAFLKIQDYVRATNWETQNTKV
ncbi:MAG: RNA polymerase factor sigma-32 [Alphaproteobacteria bacterium]|nr:RNA polymerase factor sigma-32 [Alphaproteobacteria bacterium]